MSALEESTFNQRTQFLRYSNVIRRQELGKWSLAVLICVTPLFTKQKMGVLMPQMLRSTHNSHRLYSILSRAGGDYTVPVSLSFVISVEMRI